MNNNSSVTYWQKQSLDKPLFEDILWSRPENKLGAGKLLILGGNQHKFSAPSEALISAQKAGIGVAKILMPDKVAKILGTHLENTEFAPSNRSGSFAASALEEILSLSSWADGVLLAGDFGRNSETAILLENFLTKHLGQITITQDALDLFTSNPGPLLNRAETLLVASFAQTQKLAQNAKFEQALTYDMPLAQVVEFLHNFSSKFQAKIIIRHLDFLILAVDGQVCTTPADKAQTWRVAQAARSSTYWLQQPQNAFKTLTTSLLQKPD